MQLNLKLYLHNNILKKILDDNNLINVVNNLQ